MVLSIYEIEYIVLKEASKKAIYLLNIFNYINNNLNLKYTTSISKILVNNKFIIKKRGLFIIIRAIYYY